MISLPDNRRRHWLWAEKTTKKRSWMALDFNNDPQLDVPPRSILV